MYLAQTNCFVITHILASSFADVHGEENKKQ